MGAVLSRSYKEFATKRIIVNKVVARRIGFEGETPPEGFKWDTRYLVRDKISETLPCPDIKRSHLLGIDRAYWQNGPPTGKMREFLEVDRVEEIFSNGKFVWAPVIKSGPVNIWRDIGYLFSDDSVIETVSPTNLDSGGRSTHILQREVRTTSPIEAIIFRRDINDEYLPWKQYIKRSQFTGTKDSGGTELATVVDGEIAWSNVNTIKKEFVSFIHDQSVHLLFSTLAAHDITSFSAPVEAADFNELEYLGSSSDAAGEKFYSNYFPIALDSSLKIYTVDVDAGTWQEQSIVTSFSGNNQVKVDYDLGIFIFGETGISDPPTLNHAIYIAYKVVPRIEYEEVGFGEEVFAAAANVSPLGQSLNKGFVTLGRAELDISSIVLSTTKPAYGSESLLDSYGPVYVGSDYAVLEATVLSSTGEVVPNVEVQIGAVSAASIGSFGGKSSSCERMTGYNGVARTFYTPPTSADDMGFYITSVTDTNKLSLGTGSYLEDVQDIYTYTVLKDDPWKGVVGADTNLGEIEWTDDPPNGRKVILYSWNSNAINPVSGFFGAYAPIRPTAITDGSVLTYPSTLKVPGAAGAENIGAYWVVSDRYLSVQASVYSPRYGRTIYSNVIILRVELPLYMKGSYINDSLQEIPFGWRLKDSRYEVASAINGATFITINPVSGPYPIVDVIGGEVWDNDEGTWPYGPYPTTDVSRPFAHFSFSWDLP